MRDISDKYNTLRTASASAILCISSRSIKAIKENKVPKGDVFTVARVAGVMAAKNVSQIIPYCHNIPVDFVNISFETKKREVRLISEVKAIYKTGVEMEAMLAATVAALTIYDMLKMIDNSIVIKEIRLLSKSGGKSDFQSNARRELSAAVLVFSDSVYKGKKRDESGKIIVERLKRENIKVRYYHLLPDDRDKIREKMLKLCDESSVDLIVTTGGTGFSPRDCTPEATLEVIEREIYGIPEIIRAYGQERTPYSMLSRGVAGIRGNTIIVNLPGSKKGVEESLDVLFPSLLHSFEMLWGRGH